MHLLESPRQRQWLDKRFPDGVVRHLDRIGFLSSRLAVAHGVQLRPDECDLLAERGVIVVSNPSANLRLRSGIAPIGQFRKSGLDFAIGLDGTGFSDDQDIWQEMRLFGLLHGGNEIDPAITAADIYDAVSVSAAEVLGREMDDDLVVIDYRALAEDCLRDDIDEAGLILARMTGRHVRDLHIAGRQVVADGKITRFDFAEARQELVRQARASAKSSASEYQFADRLAAAVGNFYR